MHQASYDIPRAFNMLYAPLGRVVRRYVPDTWRAGSYLILIGSMVLLGLMLLNQVVWAFLRDAVLADPSGPLSIGYWLAQVGFGAILLFGVALGFKKSISVVLTDHRLTVKSGSRETHIPLSEISDARLISGRTYHRHYRRYEETWSFVNRIPESLVLLEWDDHPVVIGTNPDDSKELIARLNSEQREAEVAPTYLSALELAQA